MQRRTAAIYFAFFVIMSASAYSVIALAHPPEVDAPGRTLSSGDTFTIDGQQYTAEGIEVQTQSGGGHGGGGGKTYKGKIVWTVEDHQYTATLANNSTVSGAAFARPSNGTYRVLIANVSDPTEFTLREQFNVTAILRADPAVENETVTRADGREYVVYEANGSTQLLSEYLPAPETYDYREGATVQYRGNQTTVANVTREAATLTWTAPKQHSVELAQDSNVTLSNETYTVYYKDSSTVLLTQAFDAYRHDLQQLDYYHERIAGLWGVVELAAIAAILVVAMAYMPVRG